MGSEEKLPVLVNNAAKMLIGKISQICEQELADINSSVAVQAASKKDMELLMKNWEMRKSVYLCVANLCAKHTDTGISLELLRQIYSQSLDIVSEETRKISQIFTNDFNKVDDEVKEGIKDVRPYLVAESPTHPLTANEALLSLQHFRMRMVLDDAFVMTVVQAKDIRDRKPANVSIAPEDIKTDEVKVIEYTQGHRYRALQICDKPEIFKEIMEAHNKALVDCPMNLGCMLNPQDGGDNSMILAIFLRFSGYKNSAELQSGKEKMIAEATADISDADNELFGTRDALKTLIEHIGNKYSEVLATLASRVPNFGLPLEIGKN